jgi:uncharacterized lipoprotein YmbA
MSASTTTILETSARRLFPDLSLDQAWAELLLERARKNLIKYQTTARRFEAKYQQPFPAFRQWVLSREPPAEVEQDYFDWELAVTGSGDMAQEIKRLSALG